MPARVVCGNRHERLLRDQGYTLIAGVDEVGRGALFGPVYAGAVILSPDQPIRGLRDSKELDPARREVLAERIRERAVAYAIAWAEVDEIERLNIYQASRLAMRRAVELLQPVPDSLLIDALRLDLPQHQVSLIKGDAQCQCIAAASILAKVERDAAIVRWHDTYPQYGLAQHKGYGTPAHMKALREHGPTPQHRRTFQPVAQLGLQW